MTEPTLKEKIGQSLGRIVSGVAILTTRAGDQPAGMLVSWYQQAGFEPPLVSVAVKKGRPAALRAKAAGKFALNILHTGQKDMLAHFGKGFEAGENPFDGIETQEQHLGLPLLKKSLCFLECRLRQEVDLGEHELLIGEVVHAGAAEEGQPMVHVRRNGFAY